MQVLLLGPFEVRDGDTPVEVRGARLRALLARLALDAGRPVSVGALAASLWEADEQPADIANAIQSLVSRLRRTLPEPALLESSPAGYRLRVAADDVDALRFAALARRAVEQDQGGDAATARAARREAAALWRGAALADLQDAPFAPAEAAALEGALVDLTEARIGSEIAAGRARDVLAEATALAAEHPLRESAAALLVRALDGAGRPAEALEAYEHVRRRLSDALGVDPSRELQELHGTLLRGEHTAPPTSSAAGGTLPSAVTSFLGRDKDVARIRELLETTRLVTLIGTGGAGKTRLAVEAARTLADSLPCWFVELASVSEPDEIPNAVLDTLDARGLLLLDRAAPASPRDATARVVAALAGGPALLVLDNCEHVVDAAAGLVEQLLRTAPELRVLATSREALALTGEVVHPVQPLPRPDGDSLAAAAGADSVRLFVDRAQAASPGFTLDDTTVVPVVEVCRRLDGLPLAIELAAARLRTMTVGQLASRLDDRFRLLTGTTRTAIARHRTLRAVVEWSWELLSDDEREVADVLAVFPPGADAAAVAAVLWGSDTRSPYAEELLGQLVEKSIVVLSDTGDDPRYRMLETLREFGGERLATAGDLTATRRAHATYYRDLAERVEPELRTAGQLDAFATYDRERDNLVAALRFSVDNGDADTAARLAAAMGWYWLVHDSNVEAQVWFDAVLSMPPSSEPVDRYAVALVTGLHTLTAVSGDEIAWDDKARVRQLVDRIPEVEAGRGHPLLVFLPAVRAWLDDADSGFMTVLGDRLDDADTWTRGIVLVMRAYAAENAGDVTVQLSDAQAALTLFTEVGDRWGSSTALQAIANARLVVDDLDGATESLMAALGLARELDSDLADVVLLLVRLAGVRARRGDLAGAEELLDRAEATSARGLWRESRALVAVARAMLRLAQGDVAGARQAHDLSARLLAARAARPPQLEAGLAATGVEIDLAEGRTDGVRERLAAALALARSTRDMPVVAAVATATASWRTAVDDPRTAARVLGVGAALRGGADATDPLIARLTARLVDELGAERLEAEYAAGAELPRAAALDLLETLVSG